MASITLITGGARSGKSRFALELAMRHEGKRFFIATAQAFDPEMEERIRKHRIERGSDFSTIEAPLELSAALRNVPPDAAVILIDCLTVWLGNLLFHYRKEDEAVEVEIVKFTDALSSVKPDLIVVTNEVGAGIVPDNALARKFRDIAGGLNRDVAARADTVYLCVCGIPLAVKGKGVLTEGNRLPPRQNGNP
ncbi:MAG: bifunctional adenosylcobinamide kinase/adenosylcobinamide-phosphate guanylyltransferase [Chitinispirillaceae bacterium]|nr:bifunctional adenosylcobinamide kinase/adenosylcobinamide-phosphate guanylyltransferase [Chitinispirillaceae bacterium]